MAKQQPGRVLSLRRAAGLFSGSLCLKATNVVFPDLDIADTADGQYFSLLQAVTLCDVSADAASLSSERPVLPSALRHS